MAKSCDSVKTTTLPPSFDSDNPPDFSIMPKPGQVVTPSVDRVDSKWKSSPCNPTARYRYTVDGQIDVEGAGVIVLPWLSKVDEYKQIIDMSADSAGISSALLAGIVAAESGGNPNTINGDRLGLTQLPRDLAMKAANKEFPASMTPVEVDDQTIMQPVWNLMHGAKAISYLIDSYDMNLVVALSFYDHSSVRCAMNPECGVNRWSVWTNCDYIDKVIAYTNAAVKAGYAGPRQIYLGDEIEEDSNLLPYLMFGAIGASIAYAVASLSKKRGKR